MLTNPRDSSIQTPAAELTVESQPIVSISPKPKLPHAQSRASTGSSDSTVSSLSTVEGTREQTAKKAFLDRHFLGVSRRNWIITGAQTTLSVVQITTGNSSLAPLAEATVDAGGIALSYITNAARLESIVKEHPNQKKPMVAYQLAIVLSAITRLLFGSLNQLIEEDTVPAEATITLMVIAMMLPLFFERLIKYCARHEAPGTAITPIDVVVDHAAPVELTADPEQAALDVAEDEALPDDLTKLPASRPLPVPKIKGAVYMFKPIQEQDGAASHPGEDTAATPAPGKR